MENWLEGIVPPEEQRVKSFVYEVCDSTNARAREWLLAGNSGPALFASAEQTAGRGRNGRSFYSPPGSGVYFSLAFPVEGDFCAGTVGVTCAAAVAVREAVRVCSGREAGIKWVNDLLLDGRKICGILAEAITDGGRNALIIGIGINVRPAEFPPELDAIAGSVGDSVTPLGRYVSETVRRLLPFLRDPGARDWLEEYRRNSLVVGREITVIKGAEQIPAFAEGINRNGELIVRMRGEKTVLRTGEISVRL